MTALVTGNIALLAGAPQGISRLRALILELAIRGKLVPHDAEDEHPSEFFSRIDLGKAARFTKGELARFDSLASSPVASSPFVIPPNWEWRRLGALGLIGSSSRVHQKDWTSAGVPFYRTREIVQLAKTGSVEPDLFISEELYDELTQRGPGPAPGDIMLTGVGTIGVPYVVQEGDRFYFKDASVLIFKNHFDLSPEYLSLVFSSPYWKETIHKESMGTTVHTLTISRANEVLIPVAPAGEQTRIVAKVDELMALCDRLEAEQADAEAAHAKLVEALLASLTQARDAADFRASWQQLAEHFHTLFTTEASIDALKQAIVHLAVMGKLVAPAEGEASAADFLAEIEAARAEFEATPGRRTRQRADQEEPMAPPPYPAPAGWVWRNLGSLLLITGGVTLGRKLAGRELVSLPYLRVANVQRGFLVLDQVKEIEVPADEVEKYELAPGDLLTTEGGDWDKVGRTAIWQGEIAHCLHQNHVFRSRPYTDKFSSRWVELYLNSPPARDYFAGSSKQTTNLASINMTQLRACAFPVPPLAEQQRIVAAVDALLELCDQLKLRMVAASKHHEQVASVMVAQAAA